MVKKETLSVTQLDLDITNPRTKAEENQTDALRSLLAVEGNGEKVYELARDICEMGMLDPGDRLYVMSDANDRFIVLDGNRRLAALRLLSQQDLDIGISQSLQNRFKQLQNKHRNKWPIEVEVAIFDNREEANHFIRLRHTGENSGAGRSAWSALQIARFDNTGLWQCLNRLRTDRKLNLEVTNELDGSAFNITNFGRVVESEEFQRRFGYHIRKSEFNPGENPSRSIGALARVASDVTSGRVTSRGDFAKAETMSPYINEVEAEVNAQLTPAMPTAEPQSTTSNGNAITIQDKPLPPKSGPTAINTQTTTFTIPRPNPSPNTLPPVRKQRLSKFLLVKSELLHVTNSKCHRIVSELKQEVPVEAAPYACALLLRCLQELTAEIYVRNVIGDKPTNRSANLDATAKHLLGNPHPTDTPDKQDIAKNFEQFRNAYEQLSSTAHSSITALSSDHLRSTWKNLSGGMDLLWKRIHEVETKRSQEPKAN